ncbi:hypothetical protein SAMN05446935_0348 [Burkholderia sp. YR290]|nr:hypothetical protein SAMN05446935_0348 [Burkholderia sp. YR290]
MFAILDLAVTWLGKNPITALLIAALIGVTGIAGVEAVGREVDKHQLESAQAKLATATASLATANAEIDTQNDSILALKAAGDAAARKLKAAQAKARALASTPLPALPEGCEPAVKAANAPDFKAAVLENWQ